MAQTEGRKLDAGDTFPDITLYFADSTNSSLSAAAGSRWCLLLFYRGDW